MIEASGLTKSYRHNTVVDNISFRVETGKVTGFLGPNGAGKSTTMRLMLGLDTGGGCTTYDGRPLTSFDRPSQVIGILLEAKAFHPTRSARNHLRILADAGGISLARVEEVLDIVGIADVAHKGPGKFSLGMSQRLGIAAAILGSPKYLLLDEPANGLDPEGIAWLRKFIRDYAAQNKGVFVSSHLLSEMAQMADNIVVIGKGKLIADTTMSALTSGSAHAGVFVRTPKLSKLEQVFRQKLISFSRSQGGLIVNGLKTEDVGKLAFDADVPVLELSNQSASLEDAFLELTAGAAEYKTHNSTKSGGKL